MFLDLMRNKDIKAAMVQKAFRKFLYAPERRELQEELFHELAEHYGQAVGFFYVIPMSASEGEHFAGSVCTALSDCMLCRQRMGMKYIRFAKHGSRGM